MAAGLAFVVRRSCPGRAFARLCAGGFLPGARPALVAATDATVALLVASEGAQDGEGQLEVVCEQPVFAAVRAVAPLPAGAPGEQVCAVALCWARLPNFLTGPVRVVMNAVCRSHRLAGATHLLRWWELPPHTSSLCWPPFTLVSCHCSQDLLALLTDSGFLSILRFDAVLCRWVLGSRA